MKHIILMVLVFMFAIAAIAARQAVERKQILIATPEGPNIGLTAEAIQRQAPIIRLRGNVEIRTKDMILHGSEADYNENTGEIEARGTVRIKLETHR
ncbi:MAG TPA: hypothetical protein VFR18_24820 [Terriglobia bacterium]|nr:hypothetical protein [Terriglobia bacterium]